MAVQLSELTAAAGEPGDAQRKLCRNGAARYRWFRRINGAVLPNGGACQDIRRLAGLDVEVVVKAARWPLIRIDSVEPLRGVQVNGFARRVLTAQYLRLRHGHGLFARGRALSRSVLGRPDRLVRRRPVQTLVLPQD